MNVYSGHIAIHFSDFIFSESILGTQFYSKKNIAASQAGEWGSIPTLADTPIRVLGQDS